MKIYLNSYLQRNLGDDLFVHILTKRYPQHTFFSATTDKTYRNRFKGLRVFDWNLPVRIIKKFSLKPLLACGCDFVLTLGGSMFIEKPKDNRKRFSFGRKDHYILGVNFGPYTTEAYFDKIKALFSEAKDVCFRENYSYNLFKSIPQVRVGADIVFSLPTSDLTFKEDKRVVISVISCKDKTSGEYEAKYLRTLADMISHFKALSYEVTLMSFCRYEGDEDAVEKLMTVLDDRTGVSRYYYNGNINEALNILASCSVVVGGRFHANVLGLLMNKTVIPMIYSDKTKNILDDLSFKGLMIDIRQLDSFDMSMLNEDVLHYRHDVTEFISSAERHFEKLDERLG